MFILYDLINLIIILLYFPVYLFRGKFHREFFLRFGFLPKGLNLGNPIWVHAVSVGEANMVKSLLEELRKNYPGKKFVISTVTPTGNQIARKIAAQGDLVTYLPLDFSFIVRGVIKKIKPSLFIIAETELWPNLISCLSGEGIPVAVVNGRISDNSFRGYLFIKYLLKSILNKISMFCVQGSLDAQRLMQLGVPEEKIHITGNMKFDSISRLDFNNDSAALKQKLGITLGERLFVAGSTHPGEDEIILNVYKELIKDFSDLRLLIAPRHPERASDIIALIKKPGFESIRISLLNSPTRQLANSPAVFILDTIGQLISYYAIADIVFVGGSLIKKGGQNILEPAALGKPVIFGPHMFNFRDIAELFLNNKAAFLVRNATELQEKTKYLLNNSESVSQLGAHAKELILSNQGATKRSAAFLRKYIV